jgi:hypothetical protein
MFSLLKYFKPQVRFYKDRGSTVKCNITLESLLDKTKNNNSRKKYKDRGSTVKCNITLESLLDKTKNNNSRKKYKDSGSTVKCIPFYFS